MPEPAEHEPEHLDERAEARRDAEGAELARAALAREETEQLLNATLDAIDDKLGGTPIVLEMTDLLGVVDLFVVTSGRSDRQVRTLAEEVERVCKARCGRGPARIEGLSDARWVLMDFGDVVVHVFDEETRAYYDLEHLWSAAPRRELQPRAGADRR